MRKFLFILTLMTLVVSSAALAADTDEKVKDLEKRVRDLEAKSLKNRIQFSGEYRFEAHNLHYEFNDYVDAMAMQSMFAGAMFWDPMSNGIPTLDQINQNIESNSADWQAFVGGLTFADYQAFMGQLGQLPPEMMPAVGALLGEINNAASREGYKVNNDIMYTNRLRLNMAAEVAKNVSFHGRLSMYKTFGDATGVQVFNGQSNSFIVDGNTAHVPNSDMVRVERAYFTWNNLFNQDLYLSIGRRPSTDGPPMHLRNDEKRGGSPMASLIDMQFDGITAGWRITDWNTLRVCYGLGYESQYGNGVLAENPLKDAHFLGVNWDLYDKDDMFIQTTVARGFDVTDGFNGLIVMPNNPVTGEPVGAPVMMRFSPSANLGDIDLAGLLLMRRDGPVDWFGSFNYMKSHPNDLTTPFGGLFCDPFTTPESQDATMFYLGARLNLNKEKTKIGLEYNHGSEYWFNFTPSQDDIIAPKTNTRGSVWEGYVTHRIARRFIAKLGYQLYDYEYSGSGWHVGAPKDLDETPALGFATPSKASALTLSLMARF